LNGFTTLQTEATTQKILLAPWVVKGKIALENNFGLQGKIDALYLKYYMPKENAKNSYWNGATYLIGCSQVCLRSCRRAKQKR
jgi:hypothetical protein